MQDTVSPQLCAVGEDNQFHTETQSTQDAKQSYASKLVRQPYVAAKANLEFCPVTVENGIPTIEFTIEEVNTFTKEEGLQQAVVIKFSYGKPELQELRRILPKQLEVKGNCNIGQLEYRHILVRFDLFEDFANVVSRTTGYVKAKGDDFFFRTFPWTMGFNPREETSKAVVWISFPDLPANVFAKKSLMSIASAVGKPIAVDKATKDRTRPSTARVKVLINLLDKLPQKVNIKIVDSKSGKIIEYEQRIVFDNLPKYCTCCNHQGHDVKSCRWNINEVKEQAVQCQQSEDRGKMVKLRGDAREYLNANRAARNSERFVSNESTGTGSPAPTNVLNVNNNQVVAILNSDLVIEMQSNLVTDKATNDHSNFKVPAEHMVQLQSTDSGSPADVICKPSTVLNDNSNQVLVNLNADPLNELQSNLNVPSELHTYIVQSKLKAHSELLMPKSTIAAAEVFNQKVIVQQNGTVPLKRNDPTEIEQSKDSAASSEKDLQTSNRTEMVPEQMNPVKITTEVTELHSNLHTDIASKLQVHSEHMMPKLTFVAAEVFNQKAIVQQNATVPLKRNPTEIEQPKISAASIEEDFQTSNRNELSQTEIVQSENTVASVEKGLNPSIRTEPIHDQELHTASAGVDLQALDQATDESVSKQELDQAKSVINSPDKVQGECSAKEKKAASPKTKDRKKFQFEENKALPSVSNSFDVLANVDDDERTNMELKSCHSQTSSQKSEAKNASHAKDTILQTRSNLKSISDHKVPKRAKSSKPKLWKDQGDYDDEETWGEGLASFSWEEEDQGSGEDSEDSIEQKIERKIANKNSRAKANQTATSNRRLNHNAPVYVPANNVKAVRSFEGTSTVNNNDRHLNSAEDSVDDRFAIQQPSTNHHTNQKHSIDVNTVDMSQAKQLVTADLVISSEEKQSLEVIVNTETNIISGSSVLNSQELPKISCARTHIYEEGEEEDFINQCRADASIKGDLSPMHSARIKKSHQRERSWDGNMVEVRKPPMRNAKQKQAAQTNFPKSNRLKNKS